MEKYDEIIKSLNEKINKINENKLISYSEKSYVMFVLSFMMLSMTSMIKSSFHGISVVKLKRQDILKYGMKKKGVAILNHTISIFILMSLYVLTTN